MAPPSALHQSAIPSDFDAAPYRPLTRSSTLPVGLGASALVPAQQQPPHRADPSHLAPEDAFHASSPPRRLSGFDAGSGSELRPQRRSRRKEGGSRSRSRQRKRFQKLLWVNQSYPDNYTDQATFLENLQRNPRLQPYDFWPLIADSTVIVQHVCSVIIFIVCFVGIFQERVSPVSVVGWGSFATSIGWLLWDWWVGQEKKEESDDEMDRTRSINGGRAYRDAQQSRRPASGLHSSHLNASTTTLSSVSNWPSAASSSSNLVPGPAQSQESFHSHRPPLSSLASHSTTSHSHSLLGRHHQNASTTSLHSQTSHARAGSHTDLSPEPRRRLGESPTRAQLRLSTIKSAVLIYFTLLGLSPILKSLTRSTSSDSIWAMSFWLLAINIFFFDYSGTWVGVSKFPVASLSTNAALMASTVLASRLPSTGQVFSLTLFSIEVFGLFPVFRRYARHRSWHYHVVLTALLVLGAGAGVGMIVGSGDGWWPWKNALLGMVVACLIAILAMGSCSWWLIGLQKYKNEIYGPWDTARPIIISRRHWDDE